ncbi:MAG TPA: hypothetical protein VK209_01360 [Candidatus Sulfotelmatobacter sp.]|nr:hypothetical protein [Candidatus Sulfotelmatobacter sp.]
MKRVVSLALVIVTVCSLLFAVYATLAFAVNPSYSITVYGGTDATIDGKWTTDAEWDDAATAVISPNAIFRLKYYFAMSGSTF